MEIVWMHRQSGISRSTFQYFINIFRTKVELVWVQSLAWARRKKNHIAAVSLLATSTITVWVNLSLFALNNLNRRAGNVQIKSLPLQTPSLFCFHFGVEMLLGSRSLVFLSGPVWLNCWCSCCYSTSESFGQKDYLSFNCTEEDQQNVLGKDALLLPWKRKPVILAVKLQWRITRSPTALFEFILILFDTSLH